MSPPADTDPPPAADTRPPPSIRRYRPKFAPEFLLGGGAIGGSGSAFGASQVGFSDLLGNHRIRLALGIYGSLENSNIAAAYENRSHRLGWAVAGFHHANRYRRLGDRFVVSDEAERLVGGAFEVRHPTSKFTRLEYSITIGSMNELYRTRALAGSELGLGDHDYWFGRAGVALVNDTVIWGVTGPIRGRRLRLELERTQGELRAWTVRADLRRYYRPTAGFTVATRLVAGLQHGHLAENWHLGVTNLVHGLRYGELIGTRFSATNLEVRFPFIQRLDLGFPLPLRFRHIGGALFVDAAAAWTGDFTNGGSDWDRARAGNLLGAYGGGIRANVGFAILQVDLAQRTNFTTLIGKPRGYTRLGVEF